MKTFVATAALAVLALPAVAVDLGGYRCENSCPLATQANSLRAYGLEAPVASSAARGELADELEASLAEI